MVAKKTSGPKGEGGSSTTTGTSTGSEGAAESQGAFGGFIRFLAQAGAQAQVSAQEIREAAEAIGESRDAKVSGAATKGTGKAAFNSERLGAGVDQRGFQESIGKIASGMAGAIGRK